MLELWIYNLYNLILSHQFSIKDLRVGKFAIDDEVVVFISDVNDHLFVSDEAYEIQEYIDKLK